jgi:phage repressor protein C with HTH and peptisase S24 domain
MKNQDLINLRKGLGMNQTEFAETLGCPQPLIAMVENGKRKAPQSLQDALLSIYNFTWKDTNIANYSLPPDIISIPIYNISASAGAGTYLTDEPEKEVMFFDKRFLKQILKSDNYSNLHIIYAKGDSMDSGWNQPEDIKDGDLLMIDTSQVTGNYQTFVIVVNNQELRVKQLLKQGETLHIISRNPKYKTEIYRPDDTDAEIRVVGRVIWNGSKENV